MPLLMRNYTWLVFVLCLGACDTGETSATLPSCRAIAQAAPLAATIPVGSAITIAATAEVGCPLPLVRNETPAVIQIDSVAVATVRVTARAVGDGRVRIRSGVDTLVSIAIRVTVTAR